ncbi:MAG: GT4 family glycosyltransferase PelF [Gracilimonas sp.]|uniref:GT4 family glycosyltransferase PelF n=1 Tax=Gracilimonas sp. TaxID=1974203 RepID=UPI001B11C48F|nr:GT4 family glycosyltransferase PelF [Gracilimonas sp.]MBO6586491.1 GT4 family glycosyltransferase PelF [Gracilimonas sp.]MBO6615148.1 GT4 family glycosyltransferase PelF [Gracilimonas sp.]
MSKDKPYVLFETEGSYPYSGGGVSTWSHILCTELVEKVDFELLAITGNPYVETRYRLPENIRRITHIPLWGVDEPSDYYDDRRPFSYQIEKKSRVSKKVINTYFKPIFEDFIECLFDPYTDVQRISDILYGLWKYFQYYDYKQTLRQPLLWTGFKQSLINNFEASDLSYNEQPRVFDITFGMRWLYHFLMPVAAPISDEIDVTHATLAGFPALISIAAKYEKGIPSMVTDHGVYMRERLINVGQADMPFFSKKLLVDLSTMVSRAVYYTADQISPVTTANKDWEKRFEAAEENIIPIYNGVNTDLFKPTPKPRQTQGVPTVIAVAQVFPLKDIETMIRAADIVRKEIPEVQFKVYGSLEVDKEYVARCKALVSELQLEDTFQFGGFHDQPSMIFNEGDISILTSISEGFPYTVIESMSCGRPVVATDVGGIRDALEGCGILCKPRDPQDIAKGVVTLLIDDDLRLELGRKARDRVLLTFTTEKSVNAYYDSYTKLAAKERSPWKERVKVKSVLKLLDHVKEKEFEYA